MLVLLTLLACGNDNDKAVDPETSAIIEVKALTTSELETLASAALALQAAAPAPDADGWGSGETADMEAAWRDARDAYERVEGAIAVLFPELDAATDERYDGFLAEGPDDDLFDGEGVIGVHGIERIVWADRHPDYVIAFESGLPYYAPAAFPADLDQSTAFQAELCQRLVDDTAAMRDGFEPLALDAAAAYRGVIGSMAEQYEKVVLATSGEDESRYAQYTLADMRNNLAGGEAVYAAFQPWLLGEDGGEEVDAAILAGFDRVQAAYDAVEGDAIPAPPETWNPDAPSEADLATPYGVLWALLSTEADVTVDGSLVSDMTAGAELLGIPQLPE